MDSIMFTHVLCTTWSQVHTGECPRCIAHLNVVLFDITNKLKVRKISQTYSNPNESSDIYTSDSLIHLQMKYIMFLLFISAIFVSDGAATDLQTSSILQHSVQQEKDVSVRFYVLMITCSLCFGIFLYFFNINRFQHSFSFGAIRSSKTPGKFVFNSSFDIKH